jgi:hypothetical protein
MMAKECTLSGPGRDQDKQERGRERGKRAKRGKERKSENDGEGEGKRELGRGREKGREEFHRFCGSSTVVIVRSICCICLLRRGN